MRAFAAVCCFLMASADACAQLPKNRKSYFVANDTIWVKFSSFPTERYPIRISSADTTDMGSDAVAGMSATVYFGKDSLVYRYTKLPLDQEFWLHFHSPKGKTAYRLHFNRVNAFFPASYFTKDKKRIAAEIPEVYELANIIWALSPSGQKSTNLNLHGAYYERIRSWFRPFMNHAIFKKLDFPAADYMSRYYDFRENSLGFSFSNGKIVRGPQYYYVLGQDPKFESLFSRLLPLVQDFAKKSNYLKFYRQNKSYYDSLVNAQLELVPLADMWNWLEKEFSGRFHSYKIILSPLIGASHSTQNFYAFKEPDFFQEAVMFISGPSYEGPYVKAARAEQKRGLASGIIFTEIDHNYVNPVSARYQPAIDSAYGNMDQWVNNPETAKFYPSPMSVFNEYMTHALFCLWVKEYFEASDAAFIISEREKLMVEKRGFYRFSEFNKRLFALREQNKGKRVEEWLVQLIVNNK